MKRLRLLLAIGFLLPLFAACGFQLQGMAELPDEMQLTRIETADSYSQFIRRLTILLEQNGARVTNGSSATAILEIPVNQVRKEVLSIGDNARIREYRLVHRVSFQLLDAQGNVLVPEQMLQESRVISFDEQDILAATREEDLLRDELADNLSRQLLRQLGTSRS